MNKHTIFWADDDPDDLEMFRNVMLDVTSAYEVIEFSNGRSVLDYLKDLDPSAYPCLIILDMNMPVLSGRETLAILKSEPAYESIPVVIFTTSSSELDKIFCQQLETEMVTKPPTYDSLRNIVQRLLSFCHQ
jgi:CheY-like chemotaxis protein